MSRRRWLGVLAIVLVLGSAAAFAPALSEAAGFGCHDAPASTAALAKDPRAATRALDPGQDLAHIGRVKKLLGTEADPLCSDEDGVGAAGRALVAAATGGGRMHTMPMARVAHAAVMTLGNHGDAHVPNGLEPYLAKILTAYIGDTHRDVPGTTYNQSPAVLSEDAYVKGKHGGENWAAAYPRHGEAHAVFSERWDSESLRGVIRAVAADPESFAALYDAERAYLAYYLERLNQDALQPAQSKLEDAPLGTQLELKATGRMIAVLMKAREGLADRGDAADLKAFDDAAFRAGKGTYRAASQQITTTPTADTIATRPATPAHRKDFLDGRRQVLALYDHWTAQRHIKSTPATHYRFALTEAYSTGMDLEE